MKQKLLHLTVMGSRQFLCILMVQVLSISILLATDLSAQRISSVKKIDFGIALNNVSISDAFRTIESKTNLRFSYDKHILNEDLRFSYNKKGKVADLLIEISKLAGLHFKQINENIHVQKVSKKATSQLEVFIYDVNVQGTVTSDEGEALPGVSILVKGTTIGTVTDIDGNYSLSVPDDQNTLIFSFIGYKSQEVSINGRSAVDVQLESDIQSLDEVVVTGYGTQTKQSITAAVSSITSEEIGKVHGGSTVSSGLAGKLPGVTFRMPDGRPGASATIQIRNMGDPLYVIDGIQQDAGQFNNLAPNDIESITILKDASAAIYGVRAANGVVLVTTKRGKRGESNTINLDAYYGVQNWSRFPETVNAYQWQVGKVEADMNRVNPGTSMTPEELERWKAGTDYGYKNFDWYDYIIEGDAPLTSINLSTTGGSEKINYYVSLTRLDQSSVLGREFTFGRTNMQSNIDANITKNLKIGVQINGRLENRDNPGVPGGDDYWAPRFALLRNLPWERPFANDNPEYLNDIGHNAENWGLLNKENSGYWTQDWRVLQTNFTGSYEVPFVKGLKVSGKYSYYLADMVTNGHEYTYDAYTFNPADSSYTRTGGSTNPWRERRLEKIFNKVSQVQVDYKNTFGKHTIGATFVNERIERRRLYTFQHAVPTNNVLPNMLFSTMDDLDFQDVDQPEARIGYVGRLAYSFADKYFLELTCRRDASWKFAPGKRVGYFPSMSAGWLITEEPFIKNLVSSKTLSSLKLRFSWGQLGDDNIGIDPFAYLQGYTYNVGAGRSIFDSQVMLGARYRNVIDRLTWFKSTTTDIGTDFSLFNSKVSGSLDYFYRKRTGLRGSKYDVLLPTSIGYTLPDENVNSDAVIGGEVSLMYFGKVGEANFSIGGNVSYARSKFLSSYKPVFGNSMNEYFSSVENRWNNIMWGYEVEGQFQSAEQIADYPVNIDGRGNSTLLPGDLIYKDQNRDGKIDGSDRRPIGYSPDRNPIVNFGLSFSFDYKGFDFTADFSGGSMYTFQQRWEMLWPYQNGGNLLAIYEDRWHREDPFDVNSQWVSGKYPALRFNDGGHSNYRNGDVPSTFFSTNVKYLRARTLELGYSIPESILEKVKIQKLRLYINTFNLFSIDNVHDLGIEPEIIDPNGLQYPQNKVVNFGVNLTL